MFLAVRKSAEIAIAEADVILFVVDRQSGLTPADRLTASILRQQIGDREDEKKIILVVNKCDSERQEDEATEFWELGFEKLLCLSAEHGRGFYELWVEILAKLPPAEKNFEPDEDDGSASAHKL